MQKKKEKPVNVGGQALIEGILMQGPKGAAMSVRLADGEISTEKKEMKRLRDKHKIFKLPFIRGIVSFIESMVFGSKCLMESAEKSAPPEEQEAEEDGSKLDIWLVRHFGPKLIAVISSVGMVLGMGLAVLLFVYFPILIAGGMDKYLLGGRLGNFRALAEGVIKILIFVLYMLLMSYIPDIRRVFMYHGAEHKTIFCYERKKPLTVENIKTCSRFHPRCGTSFIFLMLIISILVSTAVLLIYPKITTEIRWLWVLVKIALLPVIMGIGYEFLMFAGKHYKNPVVKALAAPGLLMQRITTKEPTDDIIEVAIEAMRAVVETGSVPDEPGAGDVLS
jgi:uncharacterized protein YqhQ